MPIEARGLAPSITSSRKRVARTSRTMYSSTESSVCIAAAWRAIASKSSALATDSSRSIGCPVARARTISSSSSGPG